MAFARVALRRFSAAATDPVWSYTHGASLTPLLHKTIGRVLEERTAEHPDRTVFVFPETKIRKTYAEFYADVRRLSSGLLALGVERGERVGIWAPNVYEWTLAQFATALPGFILVGSGRTECILSNIFQANINPGYQAHELEFCLKRIGVRSLISANHFKKQDYYELICKAAPELPGKDAAAMYHKNLPELKDVIMFGHQGTNKPGTLNLDEVMEAGNSESDAKLDRLSADVQPDDPYNIQFTSGTTGHPKGVVLSHNGVVNNAYSIGRRAGLHEQVHVVCCPPPLFHCFGSIGASLASVVHGGTTVFPSTAFDAGACLRAVEKEKCTMLYGTPTMFIDMLHHADFPKTDCSSLISGCIAGAPCPPDLCRRLIEDMHMEQFVIAYGSTETSPVSFETLRSEPATERIKTAGPALDHVEGKVVDGEGRMVRLGEKGELYTRGYNTMLRYWDEPEMTKAAVDDDRWYRTGDLARMNAGGQISIVGRSKDMLIRGGENVYPVEIENYIITHPEIQEIHVFGIADDRLGEEVCAWVTLKSGSQLSSEDIQAYCKDELAHYKIPRIIQFKGTDDYPRTISGKIQKFRMREILEHELKTAHNS